MADDVDFEFLALDLYEAEVRVWLVLGRCHHVSMEQLTCEDSWTGRPFPREPVAGSSTLRRRRGPPRPPLPCT